MTFSGFNFNAELDGALVILETPMRPTRASGAVIIEQGAYKAYGQVFQDEGNENIIRVLGGCAGILLQDERPYFFADFPAAASQLIQAGPEACLFLRGGISVQGS